MREVYLKPYIAAELARRMAQVMKPLN
jgi:hypothetical protein